MKVYSWKNHWKIGAFRAIHVWLEELILLQKAVGSNFDPTMKLADEIWLCNGMGSGEKDGKPWDSGVPSGNDQQFANLNMAQSK